MEAKTIDSLSPEVLAKIPEYQKWCVEGIFDGKRYRDFDIKNAKAAIKWHYDYINKKMPYVFVAENPLEQQLVYAILKDNPEMDTYEKKVEEINLKLKTFKKVEYVNSYLYTLNVYSDVYYTWFEYIRKEVGVPLKEETNKIFQECFGLQRKSGVYSCIFAEDVAIVCKYPKKVEMNENGLHSTTGSAVEWGHTVPETKWNNFYINGRHIEDDFYQKCLNKEVSKEEYFALDNDEKRNVLFMLYGQEYMLNFLEAEEVDSCTFVHGNGETETISLFKTKEKLNKFLDKPYAWSKRICPSTGTTYLTPVDPDIKTAEVAAKKHRSAKIPIDRPYFWQSRS